MIASESLSQEKSLFKDCIDVLRVLTDTTNVRDFTGPYIANRNSDKSDITKIGDEFLKYYRRVKPILKQKPKRLHISAG